MVYFWVDKYIHYDYRDLSNGLHPTYGQCFNNTKEWTLLSPEMSIYHDNGIGKPELKFVHNNGREAVFDGDTHEIIYDSQYRATYNYVTAIEFKGWAHVLNSTYGHLGELLGKGAGHFIFDMIPYYIGGNNRGEFTWNPLICLNRTGIPGKVSEAYHGFWNPIKDGATQYLNYLLSPKK